MINFEEELKKFTPSLEVDDAENSVYNSNSPDMTDLFYKIMEDMDLQVIRKRND